MAPWLEAPALPPCPSSPGVLGILLAENATERHVASPNADSVDHVVYATPDLERGMEEIERLTGVSPTLGGEHPGRGTR